MMTSSGKSSLLKEAVRETPYRRSIKRRGEECSNQALRNISLRSEMDKHSATGVRGFSRSGCTLCVEPKIKVNITYDVRERTSNGIT
jgi:hypothetical protein